MQSERHLESGDVAAYLDRLLGPAERDAIEAHLAGCAGCRGEVVQVSRVRRAGNARRKWLIAVPFAAAAVLALVLLRSPQRTEPVLREGGEPTLAVTLVSPADSARVRPKGALSFAWRSLDGVASYRFAITTETGDVIWTATSTDTTVRLPPVIQLRSGARYFWYVDALLPDGRSVSSRLRPLGIFR